MEWKLLHNILGRTDLINKTQIRHGACLQTTIITYPCLLNEAHAVNVLEIWERHRREPEVVREHVLGSFPISRYCIGPGKLAQHIKYDKFISATANTARGSVYILCSQASARAQDPTKGQASFLQQMSRSHLPGYL